MMMTRRLAVVVLALAVLSVGCGLSPVFDQSAGDEARPSRSVPPPSAKDGLQVVRSVGTTTLAPTTTIAAPTAPAETSEVMRSTGRPDHLRSRVRDQAQETDMVVASLAPGPSLTTTTTAAVDVAPPTTVPTVDVAPPTTVPTVDVAPPTTAPPRPSAPSSTVPTTTLPPATTTSPPVADSSAGGQFVAYINALRAEVGVGTLSRSGDLDARAQAWTEYMASTGDFKHSSIIKDLVAGSWSIAGENIGYGPSVDSVSAAFRASPDHYTNMVNTSFTSVGVGVVIDGNGVVWTTHLFAG